MAKEDENNRSFFAGEGIFCYRMMPFSLKNAGATYKRLVDKVFSDQIGRNLEAYVDDMVIRSIFEENMLKDIQETFDRYKSQPFESQSGAEMSLPFFKAFKSCADKKTIQWIADVEEALPKMKKLMEILSTLTAPIKDKVLVIYLAALTKSIRAVLLAERE
ncbi:hypothetical protein Tco_0326939 [Tanacetum coccineum]